MVDIAEDGAVLAYPALLPPHRKKQGKSSALPLPVRK